MTAVDVQVRPAAPRSPRPSRNSLERSRCQPQPPRRAGPRGRPLSRQRPAFRAPARGELQPNRFAQLIQLTVEMAPRPRGQSARRLCSLRDPEAAKYSHGCTPGAGVPETHQTTLDVELSPRFRKSIYGVELQFAGRPCGSCRLSQRSSIGRCVAAEPSLPDARIPSAGFSKKKASILTHQSSQSATVKLHPHDRLRARRPRSSPSALGCRRHM